MKRADADTFETVEQLKQQLLEQQWLTERLRSTLAAKEAKWAAEKHSLFEQLRLLIEQRFGPSTEKYRVAQADLFFNESEALVDAEDDAQGEVETAQPTARRRRRGGRATLPPELPRVEILHDLEDAQKTCAHDGTPLTVIGQEVSEQLAIIPAKVQVLRHIRLKYGCRRCEEGVHVAPLPPQPLPKSNASPALLAYIATAKYQDGLPLYRQERVFERLQLGLPRNTLARWMLQIGDLITPLNALLRRHLFAGPVLHMDETTVQVNTEPGRTASSTSYMWVSRGGPPGEQVVAFHYAPSRAGTVALELLRGFAGTLVTDGYEGYAQAVRTHALVHAGCWAHARRKFVEAQKLQPKGKTGRADLAISLIARLYAVEKQAKALPPEARHALRQEQSRPVIDKLHQWLEQSLHQVPPKGAIGKALHYLHGQWGRLTVFLEDGRIPLDNNPAENAIRPFVIGRKNWLFSQTPRGAHASAAIYSLLETAKANGLEPYAYLVDVLTRLPAATTEDAIEALLPWRWSDETLPA